MGRESRPRERRDARGGPLGKCEPDRGCCWDARATQERGLCRDESARGRRGERFDRLSGRERERAFEPAVASRPEPAQSQSPPAVPERRGRPAPRAAALDALSRGAAVRHPASVRAETTRRARRQAAQTRRHDGQTLGGAHRTGGVPRRERRQRRLILHRPAKRTTTRGRRPRPRRTRRRRPPTPASAEPSRTVPPRARDGGGRAPIRAARKPRWLPRRETAARGRGRHQPDAHRRKRIRLRRLGRPPRRRSPRRLLVAPAQTNQNANDRRAARDAIHRVSLAHGIPRRPARTRPDAKSAGFRIVARIVTIRLARRRPRPHIHVTTARPAIERKDAGGGFADGDATDGALRR
jgi:hypothetical protein